MSEGDTISLHGADSANFTFYTCQKELHRTEDNIGRIIYSTLH